MMQTNFDAVPDLPESRLVLAPPPEGSVAPELVRQFIGENNLPSWNRQQCIYELSRISVNKWAMISTFLSTTCRNKIDGGIIHILSQMPIDILTLVIHFASQHHITSTEILSALSTVRVEEFSLFLQFVETHGLLQKPKIWQTLAAMPEQYRENFIHFCKARQYDTHGLKGIFIFKQHAPESWLEIDHFLNHVNVSDFVLGKLARMSAAECLEYMRFLVTNHVDDWDAKNVLITTAETLRQPMWDFASRFNLKMHAFEAFPEAMWPRISTFIERHVQPGNTTISKNTIDRLINVPEDDWKEFNQFLDVHQIHDFEMIAEYACMSALQRNDLFDFIQKYKLECFDILPFREVSIEDWPIFIALIEANQLTEVRKLSAIASRAKDEWPACVDLIIRRNISDIWTLNILQHLSPQHFHFLCAFVNEFNIDDEHVIYGLAQIPSVRQWRNIYALAEPLFAPPLRAEDRGCVMFHLYEITKQEYRIDRIMPTYDDNERLARIARVHDNIAGGLMPRYPREYYERMREILKTPTNQLGNMYQAAFANARAINVHAEGRDDATERALQQFMTLPYDLGQIDNDYASLITYLNHFPGDFTRTAAQCVLGSAPSQADGFGPLSADAIITTFNLNITGKEFLARCWHYIQHGEFMGITNLDVLAKDRENAKFVLIRNLAAAYEDNAVVCNQGKLQRIVVGVLQGRFEGVHVDREIPIDGAALAVAEASINPALVKNTVAASLRDFLLHYESIVRSKAELKSHVDAWLVAERGLIGDTYQQYRADFRTELDIYLRLSELPEEETVIDMAHDRAPMPNAESPLCLKQNYSELLSILVRHAESEGNVAGIYRSSNSSNSKKTQVLRALESFVRDQDESWMLDEANKTKLLILIKSVCSLPCNWAPMHFGPTQSLTEFFALIEGTPEMYGTTRALVRAMEPVALSSKQLREAIKSQDFNTILEGLPLRRLEGAETQSSRAV